MRIASGVEMLEISAAMMGRTETVYPTLIWDTNTTVLVDAGYPGQLQLFQREIEKAGIPFDSISKMIITHQDIDHIGSMPAILEERAYTVEVLASGIEKPYIQGEKKPIKLTPEAIDQALKAMPAEVPQEWRSAFRMRLENPPAARVDRTVRDREELAYCGGIIVISTPGHTPGHISLYHKQSKTLIAADAMQVTDGQLLGPDPRFCIDGQMAMESLKAFNKYDIENVICYHGGLYNGNANERIAALTQSPS